MLFSYQISKHFSEMPQIKKFIEANLIITVNKHKLLNSVKPNPFIWFDPQV